MVREDLVRYVQQYSAQGYDISTLRDSLLQQGYAAQDVEEALQTVSGKKFPLIKAGFILGGIIIVLVVVLLIFGLTGEKAEVERPAYIPPEAPIAPLEDRGKSLSPAVPLRCGCRKSEDSRRTLPCIGKSMHRQIGRR